MSNKRNAFNYFNQQQLENNKIKLADVVLNLEEYKNKKKETMEFEMKLFVISVSILISTNIYIHKTVSTNIVFLFFIINILITIDNQQLQF